MLSVASKCLNKLIKPNERKTLKYLSNLTLRSSTEVVELSRQVFKQAPQNVDTRNQYFKQANSILNLTSTGAHSLKFQASKYSFNTESLSKGSNDESSSKLLMKILSLPVARKP
jgi:hypothetical protein